MTPPTMELAVPVAETAADARPSGTLEDLVLGAWEDLAARGLTDCPVCRGPLELSGCSGCGSQLS